MPGLEEGQKERFSRAFVIASAASAGEQFTYSITTDDIEGVDISVHERGIAVDFQLKATAKPNREQDGFCFDLDVRTYDLLRDPVRSGLGVLALVVVHPDSRHWTSCHHEGTTLARCIYYQTLTGMPSTPNTSTVRVKVPESNILTPGAMRDLMSEARARISP